MGAYYNEIDAYAAQWLRNLIAKGLIPGGDVDERSICDVAPEDLRGYAQCHFFAGIGGWAYAARLAGWPDDREIWTGSCPCQPFSVAGKGLGTDDPRHLWPHFFRLIRVSRPPVVMGEQVAGAAGYGWFDGVAADLESEDYASRAVDIPACSVDAPHIRSRLYWVASDMADADKSRQLEPIDGSVSATGMGASQPSGDSSFWSNAIWLTGADGKARRAEPTIPLLAHGIPARVGRLRAYGNAIVPQVAAEVIAAFMEEEACQPRY